MAYTSVGSILNAPAGVTTATTASLTTQHVGDLVVFFADCSATIHVTGLSSSHVTWHQVGTSVSDGSTETGQMWWGVVTSATTATVTISWSAADSTSNGVCWSFLQFSGGLGSTTVWSVDVSGSANVTTASAAPTCPTLTPTSGTELYAGYIAMGGTGGAGSTSGCVYQTNPYGDEIVYKLACSGSTTPAATQSPSSVYIRFGALFVAKLPFSTVQASVTLAGAGLLAATGLVTEFGTATLTGSGAFTASALVTELGSAVLAGAGTLTDTAVAAHPGSTALAGSGALSATAGVTEQGGVALAGTGVLSASSSVTPSAATALAGAGSLTATPVQTSFSTATLTAAGTLTATGVVTESGAAALAGSGILALTGAVTELATAALSGAGALAAAGVATSVAATALVGAGLLAAAGLVTESGAETLSGAGGLSATASVTELAVATLAGAGSLTAAGIISTAALYAGAANSVSGPWANLPGAVGPTLGDYATWTSSTAGDTATLDLTGFGADTILPGSTVQSVTVAVRHHESDTTAIASLQAQLYIGATPLGSLATLTKRTVDGDDLFTITGGITYADLANLKVRLVSTRA